MSWSGEPTPHDWLCHGIPSAACCARIQAPRAVPALGATLVAHHSHPATCCSQSNVAMKCACRRLIAVQGDCLLMLAQSSPRNALGVALTVIVQSFK